MKLRSYFASRPRILLWASAATTLAAVAILIFPASNGNNRAVANETQPNPGPHAEATPTPTPAQCDANSPWKTVGDVPSLKIDKWDCKDGSVQPFYNSSAQYSQVQQNACKKERSCTVRWSHIGPIGVYKTQKNPDTGEDEEVLVSLKYTFTETNSCEAARTIPPMTQPAGGCCPPAHGASAQ